MDTHVKVIGWLWILNAVLSILMGIGGLVIANISVPGQQESLLITTGTLCFFVPGVIASFAAGFGLLKFQGWARILAIIVAILNLIVFPIGTAIAIYTLIVMFSVDAAALFGGAGTPAAGEGAS